MGQDLGEGLADEGDAGFESMTNFAAGEGGRVHELLPGLRRRHAPDLRDGWAVWWKQG